MDKGRTYIHTTMAEGRWFEYSLAEQMSNIGSEVNRYIKWKKKNKTDFAQKAFERALELINLSMLDKKFYNTPKIKEISRLKEAFLDSVHGGVNYNIPLDYFQKYFLDFGVIANKQRSAV